MDCPLRRVSVDLESEMSILKKKFNSRQNSFQVLNDDPEEGNENLNLKHLNQVIVILTAPPVSIFIFLNVIISVNKLPAR